MDITEYEKLSIRATPDTSVSVSELTDQTDRTLLFGYDFERKTVHVYLKDGLIHWFHLDTHFAAAWWEDAKRLVPVKRVYPALSDYKFCALLQSKGIDVPFTSFAPKEDRFPFAGDVYEG